ncbi:hypothetical protein N7509_012062 [Penicillium cosmopolitanum]|uniref:DNA replication regulator Sld3 C-terminal domain-containing protein n=1 Tax=Penicillium cosmopolitanum TaxID=1131564 RepID=A0A9W9SM93_9EURO|nr:uncharacterized protein N7509_012062 [Penicillium cosmopolitanum]KAJ5378943.1 hypothetical protein N7509_012062 [Penicillium cosmopolitanum]
MTAQAQALALPGVLDPLSSSTLNKLHETGQRPSKKRKFVSEGAGNAAGQLATTSIVIRAHAASLSDNPLVLDPIVALPRSRFPLSWIDDASSSRRSDLQPGGGLFVADIPALENDLRPRPRVGVEQTVLVVRLVDEGAIYVVERVKRGIYSLARLARWVHEGDIVVAAKGWQGNEDIEMDVDMETDGESEDCSLPDPLNWWQAAQIEEPHSDLGLGDDFAGLRVDMVFGQPEVDVFQAEPSFVDDIASRSLSRGQSLVQPSQSAAHDDVFYTPLESQLNAEAMDVDRAVDHTEGDAKQTPAELLEGMRDHYLQALYISKTSLAYFAKGPLTRCRTAFQTSAIEGSHSPADLVEFYREAILAAKKMDLKFRESVPAAMRDAVLALSDNEGTGASKKRKSKKKKKIGKNGLYPEEDSFIHKWWKDRSMAEFSTHEGARETETKKQVSDLRLRETQLQILLILEVLSLESTPTEAKNKPKDGDMEVASEEKAASKKTKAKKAQDLNVLLELHLDRLCIWHAVSMEDSTGVESAKTSSFSENHMSGKKVESDAVRDFCTEVIIPFYASRLPDKCKLITRKFGVSGGISPVAKKAQSSNKSRVEAGAEVKRQQPAPKSRRSLQRVLTDEKAAASRNGAPSLHRSKTAPSKQESNRDSMEPLLPHHLSGSVRGGIQQAKRRDNREVDLDAAARQHETKLRKVQMLVDQKKELDAAIHALRKPNRELVAKDIAEDAVKRVPTGGSARKSKNPVRNPFGEGVQVMATPRGNRKRDAVVGMPPLPRSLAPSRSYAGEMPDQSLEESPVMIPSSSQRATSFSGPDANLFSSRRTTTTSGIKRPAPSAELGSIQETPTRPSSKLLFDGDKNATSTDPDDLLSKSSRGKGLFLVPNLPAPRSTAGDLTAEPMAPSTPISSRHQGENPSFVPGSSPLMADSIQNNHPSGGIMETPPRKQGTPLISSRSVPFQIPIQTLSTKRTRAPSPPPSRGASTVPVTPEKSQSKSIYEQLGWDDDDMDL